MKDVGQQSDLAGFGNRIMLIGVPGCLVLLAAVMVILNYNEPTSMSALVGLGFVAVVLVCLWRAKTIVSLAGIAAVTVAWAILELPGSPGILMVAPLGWLWIDGSRATMQRLIASGFAFLVALAEGAISIANNNGTATDVVGNVTLVLLILGVGQTVRKLMGSSASESGSEQVVVNPGGQVGQEADGSQAAPAWVEQLSSREREVLAELVRGASNNDIADKLHISLSTVKTHVSAILRKAGAKSRYAVALDLRPGPSSHLDSTN